MKAILGGRLIVPGTNGEFREILDHALIYDTKIVRIARSAELSADERAGFETVIDANGDYVAPGFVNVHIHGATGHDAMDDDGAAVPAMARYQASTGVTSFLPTTMTCPVPKIHRALSRIRDAMGGNTVGARVLGAQAISKSTIGSRSKSISGSAVIRVVKPKSFIPTIAAARNWGFGELCIT